VLFVSRAGIRDEHVNFLPGTSLAWPAILGAGKSLKDHLQATRKEIRARVHVHEIKAAALPATGSQVTTGEQTRLVEGLKAIVVLPLPRLPPPPLPYPARSAHPAPVAEATALDMQHTGMISGAITQPMHLTSAGSFKATRLKVPRRSARAPAAPSVPRARSANAATLALAGVKYEQPLTFVEGGGRGLAPLEFPSTCEFRLWMKDSKSAREKLWVAVRCFVGLCSPFIVAVIYIFMYRVREMRLQIILSDKTP
jgi:hypothetical protein